MFEGENICYKNIMKDTGYERKIRGVADGKDSGRHPLNPTRRDRYDTASENGAKLDSIRKPD